MIPKDKISKETNVKKVHLIILAIYEAFQINESISLAINESELLNPDEKNLEYGIYIFSSTLVSATLIHLFYIYLTKVSEFIFAHVTAI